MTVMTDTYSMTDVEKILLRIVRTDSLGRGIPTLTIDPPHDDIHYWRVSSGTYVGSAYSFKEALFALEAKLNVLDVHLSYDERLNEAIHNECSSCKEKNCNC